ncbi:pantoate--beta-alanine ligase [Raineyella sp. LH-20]|uniref:pantoate--beta-alanine ligase n=1 Tax=Raineyella sp. LH-20 TaxID=3081204 RepID=UPI00295449E7|nr:pantoate--beta-alanine ligase [Raineyella sp. LH-20]WOP17524.1 pantoate--beta-alanine ligase [Raineyella sp. LH-20]
MKVVTTREELRTARAELEVGPDTAGGDITVAGAARPSGVGRRSVGLVPTMGFLHEGHLSLVRRAREENDATVVSIFVNPTQFGPSEDLEAYPRDLDHDLALLDGAGVDLVWTPQVEDVYPAGFDTYVTPGGVADVLEGARRPGHFRGVATIISILFHLCAPDRAYFGQKDAQQVAVIRQLVRDLGLPVEIVACPIVREPDGLAMSSRNTYLAAADRPAALVLSRALQAAGRAWADGEGDAEALRTILRDVITAEPRAVVDYVSVADPRTLAELTAVDPAVGALASLAVRVGAPRLIDNLVLAPRA